jgi:hypothetical protein
MSNAITSVTQTPTVSHTTQAKQQPAQSKSPAAGTADTVHLSSAAQSLLQEAAETPAQTAQEAASGDIQAKRLVAKEAAEKSE